MKGYLPSGERLSPSVPPLIQGVSQFRNSNGEVDLSLCIGDMEKPAKKKRVRKTAKKTVTIAPAPRKKTRRGKRKAKIVRL